LIIGFVIAGPVIDYMKVEATKTNVVELHLFNPSDGLRVYMQFAFIVSMVITLPFLLFQLWLFISPGLEKDEQKVTLRFIPAVALLFVIGLSFGYFVLFPMVFSFMNSIAERLGATIMYGMAEYFGFLFNIVLPLGFLFELPVVVMFLTRIRLLNPMKLVKARRIAYFVLIVIAVTVTPPEIVSDMLVTVPLLILYEFSVFLSRIVYRKQLAEDATREIMTQ
ncbi:MAG: twin-arginine translocase subunit TatC, partial [Bacilli bacterium]